MSVTKSAEKLNFPLKQKCVNSNVGGFRPGLSGRLRAAQAGASLKIQGGPSLKIQVAINVVGARKRTYSK